MRRLQEKQSRFGRLTSTKELTIKQVQDHITSLMIGWIILNDENDTICSKTLETLKKTGLAEGIVELNSGKEVTKRWEMLDGPMEGCVGYFNPASVVPMFSRSSL